MDLGLPTRPLDDSEDGAGFLPRRSGRFQLSEVTQMRSADQRVGDVTITDISSSGFRAECAAPVLIGSYVSLDLPGIGPVHAQVRWQVGKKMGARFLDPVNLRRCDWLMPRG